MAQVRAMRKQAGLASTGAGFVLVMAGACVGAAADVAHADGPDFDGDGYADLVIGTPFAAVGNRTTAGSVSVLYGTNDGLGIDRSRVWHQDSPGVGLVAGQGDQFGQATTAGDFNGDGFDDLAVGVPNETIANRAKAGAVNVLYGSPAGLSSAGSQVWHRNRPGVAGMARPNEMFGWALASCDFNGDGFDDLAIGVPRASVAGVSRAGSVHILFGSAKGLRALFSQHLHLNKLTGGAAEGDLFGLTLAAGDFDNDGHDDLAIGAPAKPVGAGVVSVAYGSPAGLRRAGAQLWSKNHPDIDGLAGIAETFGWSLATGDLNGDGFAELVIGVPFDRLRDGAIYVLFGSAAKLTASGSIRISPEEFGILPTPDSPRERFGWTLSCPDINGDGIAELVIGSPLARVDDRLRAGALYLVPGAPEGPNAEFGTRIDQDMMVSGGGAQAEDMFGWTLRRGDFNGDGFDDIAIGAPFEDYGVQDDGIVYVIHGSGAGLSLWDDQVWIQSSIGIGNLGQHNEAFGFGRGE